MRARAQDTQTKRKQPNKLTRSKENSYETRLAFHAYINYAIVPSPPHPGVVALAAGDSHTCAGLSGGGVDCWGYNVHGQLGTGDWNDRLTPTGVTGLTAGAKFGVFLSFSLMCVRVCVRVCLCACVRARTCVCMCVCIFLGQADTPTAMPEQPIFPSTVALYQTRLKGLAELVTRVKPPA